MGEMPVEASGRPIAHLEDPSGTLVPMPSRWATRHPWLVILLLVGLLAASAPGLLRLKLRTDGHALVPPHDPVVEADREIRQHFGLGDPIVVFVETTHPDGILNPGTLALVDRLTTALAGIDGIEPEQLTSLATEKRDRVFTGTLNFRTFLQPVPRTLNELREVRSDIEATQILNGTLIGRDGRSTAIIVSVPVPPAPRSEAPNPEAPNPEGPNPEGQSLGEQSLGEQSLGEQSLGEQSLEEQGAAAGVQLDRAELYRRIREVALRHATATDSIVVVGAPVAEALLGSHIIEDLVFLVPLSLLVICAVIWVGCRRLWGVALAMTEVGAALVWTFGVMGWLGVPVYLTTAVLPVILTTIGLSDEVHLFWHHQQRLEQWQRGTPHRPVVAATMAAMTRPVALTSITTSVGFLSFLASEIPPVRFFGLFAGMGILFCMLWSLTVVPAALCLLPGTALTRPARSGRRVDQWIGSRLASWSRQPARTLVVLVVISVIAAAGAGRVVVQDSWIDGFAPGSAFRVATERVNHAMHGTHLLLVHLRFDPDVPEEMGPATEGQARPARAFSFERSTIEPLARPAALEAIGRLEAAIRRQPGVGGVLGTYSHLTTVSYLWLARREGSRSIPEDSYRIHKLIRRFDQARGVARRREVIDDALERTVITVFLKDANYRDTARLMEAIRFEVAEQLGSEGVHLDFAGDVAVSQAMIPAIVRTQVISLGLAVLGAFLCLCVIYRSLWLGLIAVAPTACAVLWVFGGSGWLGIPLGVATSMFCAITLGIGVDYAIHLVHRWRSAAVDRHAVDQALKEAGPPIVFDTVAIALGFGLLGFSQVPANARLGILVAMALVSACLLTLGGLAAALRLADRRGRLR